MSKLLTLILRYSFLTTEVPADDKVEREWASEMTNLRLEMRQHELNKAIITNFAMTECTRNINKWMIGGCVGERPSQIPTKERVNELYEQFKPMCKQFL